MNPIAPNFLLDLLSTAVLALALFLALSTITVVCAPVYFAIQFIFRSTFFVRHFGAQWKQYTLLAICMAIVGIIYGISRAHQTIDSDCRSEQIRTNPLLGKLKQAPRAMTTNEEFFQRAANENKRRTEFSKAAEKIIDLHLQRAASKDNRRSETR